MSPLPCVCVCLRRGLLCSVCHPVAIRSSKFGPPQQMCWHWRKVSSLPWRITHVPTVILPSLQIYCHCTLGDFWKDSQSSCGAPVFWLVVIDVSSHAFHSCPAHDVSLSPLCFFFSFDLFSSLFSSCLFPAAVKHFSHPIFFVCLPCFSFSLSPLWSPCQLGEVICVTCNGITEWCQWKKFSFWKFQMFSSVEIFHVNSRLLPFGVKKNSFVIVFRTIYSPRCTYPEVNNSDFSTVWTIAAPN